MVTLEDAVTARLEYYGEHFEILVDPDLASDFKRGRDIDVEEILAVEEIFKDAKKGDKASEEAMMKAFDTIDHLEVAAAISTEGTDTTHSPTAERNAGREENEGYCNNNKGSHKSPNKTSPPCKKN